MPEAAEWLAESEGGDRGVPGSAYELFHARVRRASSGRFELAVIRETGANKGGRLEAHSSTGRRYRADDLEELLTRSLDDIRQDRELSGVSGMLAAIIRDAIYRAEDAGA